MKNALTGINKEGLPSSYIRLILIACPRAFPSFGGSGKLGLDSMTIAPDGQPVAHTEQPKQR
jgi:hypothetical protein